MCIPLTNSSRLWLTLFAYEAIILNYLHVLKEAFVVIHSMMFGKCTLKFNKINSAYLYCMCSVQSRYNKNHFCLNFASIEKHSHVNSLVYIYYFIMSSDIIAFIWSLKWKKYNYATQLPLSLMNDSLLFQMNVDHCTHWC